MINGMKDRKLLQTDETLDLCFYIIGLVCAVGGAALWFWWNHGLRQLLGPIPPCALHALTGYYCPGCGGTRAVYALLHGHVLRAFFYHPVVPYGTAVCGWFLLSQTIARLSRGRIAIGMHYRDLYLWIALFLILLNWLVKNLVLSLSGIALLG